jgi:predicted MFS family arabinose efflux permease
MSGRVFRSPALPAALAPLRVRTLRRLLFAQLPADLADWLDMVALGALLAFHWERGPAALAALSLSLSIPYVILLPFVGVIIDRSDLRTVLIASNLGRAAATAAFVIAPNLPALLVIALIKSSADAFFTPTKQAAVPLLAPANELMAANALSHSINQLAKIAGPALGGALLLLLDPQRVFLVNAALSMIAALIVLGLPAKLRADTDGETPTGFFREFQAGIAIFRARPVLMVALTASAVGFFVIFLYDALIPILVKEIGFPETMFGLAIASVGAGGVTGSLLLGQFGTHHDPLRVMAVGGVLSGALVAAIGHVGQGDLTLSGLLFLGLFFVLGIVNAGMFVPYRTVQQQETPPHMLGRVAAVSEAVTTLAVLAGPPLGALLAQMGGVATPFLLGGYALVVCGLLLAFVRPARASR